MERTQCPICDKKGIPDFFKEDVVCPCCNSDLRIYRKIHLSSIKTNESKKNKWPLIIVFLFIVVIGVVGWRYSEQSESQSQLSTMKTLLAEKETKIVQLSDSIKNLLQPVKSNLDNSQWYIVKQGDSFCRISRNVYGTESKYKIIIELNNLKSNTILQPGDSIRIK